MRRLKKIGIGLGVVYLLLVALVYIFQERLIFFPSKLPIDHTYSFVQPFEEFFLAAAADAQLNAVHIKNNSTKGVVLYFHGNSGNISHLGRKADLFTKHGYDVILVDYRTYGKSTGAMTEQALYDDAQLFYDYALKTYAENEILVYGRSLGTGIASYVAANNNPCRLILESPFSSAVDLGKHRFPFIPVAWLSEFRFPSTEYMKSVQCPVYIFHGNADKVIPYSFSQQLYTAIPGVGKKLFTIENGGHNDLQNYAAFNRGMIEALK